MTKMIDGAWQNGERNDNDDAAAMFSEETWGGGGGGGGFNPYFCSRIPLPAL